MISWEQSLSEDRRLCILRILSEVGGKQNDSVLRTALEALGHNKLTRDAVRTDLRFLIDAGCITDEWLSDIQICAITRRGLDAAEGRITVKGVKKPSIVG